MKIEIEVKGLSQLDALLVQIESIAEGVKCRNRGLAFAKEAEAKAKAGVGSNPLDALRLMRIYRQLLPHWSGGERRVGTCHGSDYQCDVVGRYARRSRKSALRKKEVVA